MESGSSRWGEGPGAEECRRLLEAEEARTQMLSWSLQKGQSRQHLDFSLIRLSLFGLRLLSHRTVRE